MNKAFFNGIVGKDGEMRYTQSGTAIYSFSVAVYDGKDVEGNKKTLWINVKAFKERADQINGKILKGMFVACCGKVSLNQYTNKDGETKASIDLLAESVEFKMQTQENTQQEEHKNTTRDEVVIPGESEMF